MEYVNPVSIAQMAQGPQGQMLPGTGAGPLDMYQKNQALGQAYDFLDMSKAAGAQDYVKQQWGMQKDHNMYPIEKEKAMLGNETARQGIETSKIGNRLTQEKIDMLHQSGAIQKIAFVGSLAPALQQAAGDPIKTAMILKQGQQHYAKLFPGDNEGLMGFEFDGNPETAKQRIDQALLAQQIAMEADAGFQQKRNLLGKELDFRGDEGAANRKSSEKIASGHDQTTIEAARIRADVERATQSGSGAWGAIRAQVTEEFINAAEKLEALGEGGWAKLTPRERAIIKEGPKIVAGAYASTERRTDPEIIEKGAEGKARGDIRGTIQELRNPTKPQVPTQQPQSPQSSGNFDPKNPPAELTNGLKQKGMDYNPDKYRYFQDHMGSWFAEPK